MSIVIYSLSNSPLYMQTNHKLIIHITKKSKYGFINKIREFFRRDL